MNLKSIIVGALAGLTIGAVAAKELPEITFFQNATPGEQQKINVALYHIQELRREMDGVKQQINILHAKKQDKKADTQILHRKGEVSPCGCKFEEDQHGE